ncbi:capsid [Tadarida associated gemykibivirus 1]|nr:capsid [Tadarida associated gemykibivirus 1]
MAYARARRSRRFTRRPRRGRKKFRRSRRRYARRGMTRRKVVDIASTKCHDNMPGVSVGSDGSKAPIGVPSTILSSGFGAFLFCASARGSQWTEAESEYARQKTEVYAKGYLERTTVETVGGGNWRWRRIAFQCHSDDIIDTVEPNRMAYHDGVAGYTRTMYSFRDAGNAGYQAMCRQLFEGTFGTDYADLFNAVTDKRRNRVIMDRTMPVRSGNGFGVFKNTRDYIPINKKIRYNEKEEGDDKEPMSDVIAGEQNYTWFATPTRYSGGDVYVVDLFSCADGGNATSSLRFLAHGTYYWHER